MPFYCISSLLAWKLNFTHFPRFPSSSGFPIDQSGTSTIFLHNLYRQPATLLKPSLNIPLAVPSATEVP